FAPRAHDLTPQQMKVLRRRRRLANLHVVKSHQLQKPLDASAGVFRPLPFITMGKKQRDAGKKSPLRLSGAHKLINNGLGHVGKIAELSLPQDQSLGAIAAVSVFKTQYCSF